MLLRFFKNYFFKSISSNMIGSQKNFHKNLDGNVKEIFDIFRFFHISGLLIDVVDISILISNVHEHSLFLAQIISFKPKECKQNDYVVFYSLIFSR